jgi:hypothetical protein
MAMAAPGVKIDASRYTGPIQHDTNGAVAAEGAGGVD